MPRQARIDAPGALHHIIARGIDRRSIFEDDADQDNLLNRLDTILTETQNGLLCVGSDSQSFPPAPAFRPGIHINAYATSSDGPCGLLQLASSAARAFVSKPL